MSTYVVPEDYLTDIADAIRSKTGSSDAMEVVEMPKKIRSIEATGGSNLLNDNNIIKQEFLPEGYPYYTATSTTSIVLPQTTPIYSEEASVYIILSGVDITQLTPGEDYVINWNGVEYTCTGISIAWNGFTGIGLGDVGMLNGTSTTNDPFTIGLCDEATKTASGLSAILMPLDGSTDISLSINKVISTKNITPIDSSLLPPGYPQFIPGGEVVFPETAITPSTETVYAINIKVGCTYLVTYNGVEYICKARLVERFGTDGESGIVIGSDFGLTPVDRDKPFGVLQLQGGSTVIINDDGSPATIKITLADSYLPIDEAYVKNSNLIVDFVADMEDTYTETRAEVVYLSHTVDEIHNAVYEGKNVTLIHRRPNNLQMCSIYQIQEAHRSNAVFYCSELSYKIKINGDKVYYQRVSLGTSDAVRYNVDQDLTDFQKQRARKNIGAISEIAIPVKGVDYFTPADIEAIVQQVITALGTPVFGRVDAENNIILTGELAEGTYTIKYEDAEGNLTEIGTLDNIEVPEIINMLHKAINADGTEFVGPNGEDGWKPGYRLNSSATETAHTTCKITGFIPVKFGDVVRFKNVGWNTSSNGDDGTYIAIYKPDFTKITSTKSTGLSSINYLFKPVVIDDSTKELLSITMADGSQNYGYLRISTPGLNADSIITVNQEIPD